MGMSLAVFIKNADSGIELARFNQATKSELLEQWHAIPSAKDVTSHFLVLLSEQEHINAKFIEDRHLTQLLHLWGTFDNLYQELPEFE